jgi:hypothetical protein
VASLSLIGRVWNVIAGASVWVIEFASVASGAGDPTMGAGVAVRTGACCVPCCNSGAYAVPHAAADTATSSRPAEVHFVTLD